MSDTENLELYEKTGTSVVREMVLQETWNTMDSQQKQSFLDILGERASKAVPDDYEIFLVDHQENTADTGYVWISAAAWAHRKKD